MFSKRSGPDGKWGSSVLRTKASREPYLLQKRTLKDLKYWEWLFIVISVIGILINLGFNIYQLILALGRKERYLFPIFLCVNNLFAIFLLIVGVLTEQPFQLMMQIITRIIIWIFNLVYFVTPKDKDEVQDEVEEEVKAIRFYISSSMLFLTIPVGAFVLYQYWTSNLSLFKEVGTEPKYVNMFRTLFLGQSLILLDAQVSIISLLLVAAGGLSSEDLWALILLPLGFLFVVMWSILGHFAMKRESRPLTFAFYILSHAQPLYVIFLLVRSPKNSVGSLLYNSMIVASGLFFITHIALLVVTVRIQFNYGKGLKQAAEKEMARTKSLAESLNAVEAVNTDHDREEYPSRNGTRQTDV